MKYLVATIAADGVPHVASSTLHSTVEDAWRSVFAFDAVAGAWWGFLSKNYPPETKGPWRDTTIQGSIFRWTLVETPE